MDNKSYELLLRLTKIENPRLDNCGLHGYLKNLDYLKDMKYIIKPAGCSDVTITRLGYEALEKHERMLLLTELQKQNTFIQQALVRLQFGLAILGLLTFLFQLLTFFKK